MVWRAIAYDSRSTLIMMRGTLTGERYVDDIFRPHVGPFLNGLPGAIFQQDNARQDFLRHFQTLPWPVCSTDLSPVEHVWDHLKRQKPSCHSVHQCFSNTGRPRVIMPNENWYLAVTSKRNRRSTASDLSRQQSSATGTTVSRQTV
ncbi:DDE_3 domain-containing protein [Trichonephila clavipes]|nr:DDE_3 domain-containing protein [Trichonephila clavipes]